MPKKIILFPFGGNAREALMSVFAINAVKKKWDVLGFIDDDPSTHGCECCGIRVLGGRDAIRRYPDAMILAVPGNPDSYRERKRIIGSLGVDIERFATIIDPACAVAPDARVGRNTVLMHNVVVSCGSRVGDHCVVLANTVISHDSAIGDYCCIGSNVSVSGDTRIGEIAYIGSGVKLLGGVSVGARALVGLGSTVIRDVRSGTVVAGNPARSIKESPDGS
jgi:sugar O-acyltransferase (sialic acid O-acetyltransferase NeuD family)